MAGGQALNLAAMRRADASFVAPFFYLTLVWAAEPLAPPLPPHAAVPKAAAPPIPPLKPPALEPELDPNADEPKAEPVPCDPSDVVPDRLELLHPGHQNHPIAQTGWAQTLRPRPRAPRRSSCRTAHSEAQPCEPQSRFAPDTQTGPLPGSPWADQGAESTSRPV